MKILFTIGSLAGGGAERVVARLSNKMCDYGHKINVAMIANDRIEYDVSKDVETDYINSSINIAGLRYFSRMKNYRSYVKEKKPDVVITFTAKVNMFVLQALKGINVKVIVSERNNPYVDPIDKIQRKKRDKLYKKADGFVFQTEDARNYFHESIRKKGVIILNPIDEKVVSLHEGEREKRIVSIGRLEKQKNHVLLIEAFSKIAEEFPGYIVEIYGEGSLRSMLEKRISELGLENRVYLMGYDKDVLEHIKAASMFVLSSDYEGISNALLEAMVIKLPVISTDHPIGGARLLINDGVNGILVPVGDVDALSVSMSKVLSSPIFSKMLSENAFKIKNETSVDVISKKWLEYIERIMM